MGNPTEQRKSKRKLPVVAIMGRTNVGKSTLTNRIAARMEAIVDSTPGVTRDRKYVSANWRGKDLILIDTGGVGIETEGWLEEEVERQAFYAMEEADLTIMVVDVRTGVTDEDEALASRLRKSGTPTLLAVNKVDEQSMEWETHVFHSLGMGDPIPVSSKHGLGIGELLDKVVDRLPMVPESSEEEEIAVAIVGRPNVGKSSLLNLLAQEERAVVSAEPYTTRDTIDTIVSLGEERFRILDTAGLRRKSKIKNDIEYYSSVRTRGAIDEADVVLMMVDAVEGATDNDQKIARHVDRAGKAGIILLNKWDLVSGTEMATRTMDFLPHAYRFLKHLPVLRISALTGRGVDKILPSVIDVYEEWHKRIPTPDLNKALRELKEKHTPSVKGGRQLRLYYATQVSAAPPRIIIFVNNPHLAKETYKRFLVRGLREKFGFYGSPLTISLRKRRR